MEKEVETQHMKFITIFCLIFLCIACQKEKPVPKKTPIAFTKISTYKAVNTTPNLPIAYRLEYFFENGKPHRWIALDADKKVTTEYIYVYDDTWKHTGAKYREEGEPTYNIEKVRFENDSTQVTEWLDSLGKVYYTMTDFLNKEGKTVRAEFKGDKIHGYDTTLYTNEGFPKRILFTNNKGKVFNDRSFVYDSVNAQNDWIARKKIVEDTISEFQIREVSYDQNFTSANHIFYEGILSTGEWSESTFSFTEDEDTFFVSRTTGWQHQFGTIHSKQNGLFATAARIPVLDTIYNGAISPSGTKIIYSKKEKIGEQIYFIEKQQGTWSEPINLTATSYIQGGYFYWLNENDLFFYVAVQNGNIVQGKLIDQEITIVDTLDNLNTVEGTEFSPYVDKQKRFIIFTRFVASNVSQQGFFISYNTGSFEKPIWGNPQKITTLPYGWNAYFINKGSQFLYSDGQNINSVPANILNIQYEK